MKILHKALGWRPYWGAFGGPMESKNENAPSCRINFDGERSISVNVGGNSYTYDIVLGDVAICQQTVIDQEFEIPDEVTTTLLKWTHDWYKNCTSKERKFMVEWLRNVGILQHRKIKHHYVHNGDATVTEMDDVGDVVLLNVWNNTGRTIMPDDKLSITPGDSYNWRAYIIKDVVNYVASKDLYILVAEKTEITNDNIVHGDE